MGAKTMKEVAEAAKVSLATVSRAIRREGYVAAETRERVLRAARRLRYTVNLGAQSLRTRRTLVLAHVLPSAYPHPFYSALSHHLERAVSAKGYALTQCATESDGEIERGHFQKLVHHRVDGVLITNIADADNLKILSSAGTAYCLIERPSDRIAERGGVLVDHRHGVEAAVEFLVGLGHRRIFFLGVRPDQSIEKERLEGYRRALQRCGVTVGEEMVYLADRYSVEAGRSLVRRMLHVAEPPTAVFAASDLITIGVLQEFYARRIRVPEEISVMNFEDSWGENMVPPMTCIHMPAEELAAEAVALILERMNAPTGPAQCRTVRPRLVIRESTQRIA